MLGLVILGVYAVIGGILCCVAAQFPNARAIRSLDKLAAMLTGQRPPDTLAFLRYRQRMNRAVGFSFMLMGVWILAYAWTDFGHWLVVQRSAVLFWGLTIGVPLLSAFPP